MGKSAGAASSWRLWWQEQESTGEVTAEEEEGDCSDRGCWIYFLELCKYYL
jgi:hypothetical protein